MITSTRYPVQDTQQEVWLLRHAADDTYVNNEKTGGRGGGKRMPWCTALVSEFSLCKLLSIADQTFNG